MPGKHSVRNDTLCPALGAALFAYGLATPTLADAPANNFPTLARVEYVQECINRTGGKQTNLYQCACVVDRIAESMSYDDFVESSMFARYSTLPGEGGGLFRDTDEAKEKAKLYRTIEANAFRACNLSTSTPNNAAPAAPTLANPAAPAKDKS
jgi:hypothetical protein